MQMREALAVASTKSRLAAVGGGALFQMEIHADRDLCFDRLATERGGTITPLTDRRERRRNQTLVALDRCEKCSRFICDTSTLNRVVAVIHGSSHVYWQLID